MAFARDVYTASAAQTDFTITFPYLNKDHVVVSVDGVLQTVGALNDYTFSASTTIQFVVAMAGSETVEIRRSTSQSTRLVNYTAGPLSEADLDNDSLQGFYMAQEANDTADTAMSLESTDNWDAESRRIKNLATPTASTDAVTKAYSDALTALSGNVPTPDNPGQDNYRLKASGGSFSWALSGVVPTPTDPAQDFYRLVAENATFTWKEPDIADLKARFGAVGDGITDDTAAIQAAADSTATAVYFPPGTYIVNDTIDMDQSAGCRRFFGPTANGRGNAQEVAILKNIAANILIDVAQAGIRLQGLSFDHSSQDIAYDGQTVNFTIGETITGGTSGATAKVLSDVDGGATGTLFVGIVTGTFVNDEVLTGSSTGVAVMNGTLTLSDRDDPQTLVYGKRNASAEDLDLTVWDCHFDNFTSAILTVGRGTNVFDCVFQSGNVGIDLEFDFSQVGVDTTNLGHGPDDAWRSVWISRNRFHGINQTCIMNDGTNHFLINGAQVTLNYADQNCLHFWQGSARHTVFSGNYLTGCTGVPFYFIAGTTCRVRDVTITGNFIWGWHTKGKLSGFTAHTRRSLVGDRPDMAVLCVEADVDGLNIVGNTMGSFNKGCLQINDNGAQNIVFSSNQIKEPCLERTLAYDTQTGNFTTGLQITGSSSGATAWIVEDTDDGTTGTLVIEIIVGVFTTSDTITDTDTGSADVASVIVLAPVINTANGGSITHLTVVGNNVQWGSASNYFIGVSSSLSNETVAYNTFNVEPLLGYGPSGMAFTYVDTSGNTLFSKRTNSNANAGVVITPLGQVITTRDGNAALNINRLNSDGTIMFILQDDNVEGSISVSSATVSYNAFMGSHYSEMVGDPPPLGSIMEVAPGMVIRRHSRQERLPRCKLSDTAGSQAVYGVYLREDDEEEVENANPGGGLKGHYIAALGAGWVRVEPGPVAVGDLIESAGDGTGRVQADDIIRSKTVCKITSLIPKTVDQGVRLLPCTLMCG